MAEEEAEQEEEDLPFFTKFANLEGNFKSPIDINIAFATAIEFPPLEWIHFEDTPKKIKLINTGLTVSLGSKWYNEYPYICGGPLEEKYVFSQIHFHWGKDNMEGGEHYVDGSPSPLEMHVSMFKHPLDRETAVRTPDGVIILVYFFKLQHIPNPDLEGFLPFMPEIKEPHAQFRLQPLPLDIFMPKFENDYLMYWGAVTTTCCIHPVVWMICRLPIGISYDQLDYFRDLLNEEGEPLYPRNRYIHPLDGRHIFHVNPSGNCNATLLPLPNIIE